MICRTAPVAAGVCVGVPILFGQIKDAARRLDEAVQNGTRVKMIETEGAARLHTATVEEMTAKAEESRANA